MAIFASDDLVPATRIRLNFGGGKSTAGAGTRRMLIVGPMLDTGLATANTVYQVNSEAEVETWTGAGSPIHQAARGVLAAYKKVPLYILPCAETSGGAEVKAEAEFRIQGTATKTGQISFTLANTTVSVGFVSGDTYSAIGDDLEAVLNAISHAPANASNTDGYVTVSAKLAGSSQNDSIRVRASVTPGCGISIAETNSYTTLQNGSDGSTTELANITTALATVENERFYYIVPTNNATSAILKTHLTNKAEPDPGLRSVGILGFVDDAATAETLAQTLNYERVQLIAQTNSEVTQEYLVGHWAGIRAKRELENKRWNFSGYSESDWAIPRVYESGDIYTSAELKSGVKNGVTLVQSGQFGSYVVKSVTTASKNSAGTIDDFRKSETHVVSVADEVADIVVTRSASDFRNKALKDDQYLSDGVTINPKQAVPPNTITPKTYKDWLEGELATFNQIGWLDKYADTIESINASIDSSVSSRLNVELDLYVIPLLHQTGITINESSSG
jgi:phage tail sheath gpL-like